MRVVLVSWNVHAWVGDDGRRDPRRALAALRAFDADVAALQEVDGPDCRLADRPGRGGAPGGRDVACDDAAGSGDAEGESGRGAGDESGCDWERLASAAGYRSVRGPTLDTGYGNALLVRRPLALAHLERLDLSVLAREPRGAIDARLALDGGDSLRVVATHLGLRSSERRHQARQLARHLEATDTGGPIVLLGDFNDWTPWAGQLAPLARIAGPLSRVATFPSRRPILPLDRAACRLPPECAASVAALRMSSVR
ncbi:MAG: endonuclease/exonuclease/phosphatase family protein, partial [Myxococcales bacterium]|nr:endonuclease/exonuclease/phosphatase family protein [Myxococcales bacterium]